MLNFRKRIVQMTIVIIKNIVCMLSFSISNANTSIGSCLELNHLISKDIRVTLKYKILKIITVYQCHVYMSNSSGSL